MSYIRFFWRCLAFLSAIALDFYLTFGHRELLCADKQKILRQAWFAGEICRH